MMAGDPKASKPMHAVALALVWRPDEWLVARRRSDAHLGGLWEFPGGKQLPGEDAAQAAIRELREECAVQAAPVRVLPMVECEYDDRIVQLTPVLCRWVSGTARPLGSEICRWVGSVELRGLEMPAVNAGIVQMALAAQGDSDRA